MLAASGPLTATRPQRLLWERLKCRSLSTYWRAHPSRGDRQARALAAPSQAPCGWTWQLGDRRSHLPFTFRTLPAPYRKAAHALGTGFCCVCGRPVDRVGWNIDLWGSRPNKNAVCHSACVVAWQFGNGPSSEIKLLRRLQNRRGAQSCGRLWRNAEVDHLVPLFRVWSEHRDRPWPGLLAFWGLPNQRRSCRQMRDRKRGTGAMPAALHNSVGGRGRRLRHNWRERAIPAFNYRLFVLLLGA
jgi:hypothetical protein